MIDWAMYGNINPFSTYRHFKKSSKPFLGNMHFPDDPLYTLLALYLRTHSVVAKLYLLLSLDMTCQSALVRKIQLNSQQNSQEDFVSLEEASQNRHDKIRQGVLFLNN